MVESMLKKAINNNDKGEVMIESTIVTIITIMVLIFLIAVGFLVYQQVMMSDVAAETATSIARNYKFSSDTTMLHNKNYSSITIDDNYYEKIKKYRTTFNFASIKSINQNYSEQYVNKRLPVTSMSYDNSLVVDTQIETSSIGRTFVTVTISMDAELLFDGVLSYGGMNDDATKLTATSTAECLDITGYAGLIHYAEYLSAKGDPDFKSSTSQIIKDIKDIIKIITGK